MDEISEAQDQMQQMNDVLSQPIGTAADLDEDELAAELAVRFLPFCVPLQSRYCLPSHALQHHDCTSCSHGLKSKQEFVMRAPILSAKL